VRAQKCFSDRGVPSKRFGDHCLKVKLQINVVTLTFRSVAVAIFW